MMSMGGGNGYVDIDDLRAMAAAWLTESGDLAFDYDADLARDGRIDNADVDILSANWLQSGVTANSSQYYYHFDGLGSVVALTNAAGEIVEAYKYTVYGQTDKTSYVGNPYMFTGRRYDTETKSPYIVLDKEQWERAKAKWRTYQQQRKPWCNKNLLNNVLTNFKRHLKKAGIRPNEGRTLSVHCLRKSCIQNWANNITNPEVVRVLAGHSDLKTTMQYYCQVDKEQRAKAAAAIDHLLKQTDARVTPSGNFGENSGNKEL